MQHSRLIACVFLVIATYLVSTTHSRARTSLYPVERSIKDAEDYFQSLSVQETHTYAQAVESYQYRRGRCPPPGFRAFYDRLQQLKGISIEPFWDQIYDDLEPFWGVTAQVTQTAAASLVSLAGFQEKIERLQGFSFRRGEVRANCQREDMTCDDQLGLLRKIAPLLPDIDVAVSVHASPRVLVPWDVMKRARQQARQHSLLLSRSAGARTHVHGGVSSAPHSEEEDVVKGWNRDFPPYAFHDIICPPKNASWDHVSLPKSAVQDVCAQSELAGVHGTMLAPHLVSTSFTLLPIFSATHIRHVSAEITVPDLHTWVDIPSFTLPEHLVNSSVGVAWSEKRDRAIWRGSNTGGRHNALTWKKSHRHRFVASMNSTFLTAVSRGQIDWTSSSLGNISSKPPHSEWMNEHVDCAFTQLRCAERGWDVGDACSYLDHHFRTAAHTTMADMATYKYLPDIDGNAYSARFRALLMTGSVVLKATIFDEWHRSRLVPYKHFVPFDLGNLPDLWHKLCFFIGGCCQGESCGHHDKHAAAIGENAAIWSRRVLRKADMELYWLRLLLEYARVVDERRHVLCERDDNE